MRRALFPLPVFQSPSSTTWTESPREQLAPWGASRHGVCRAPTAEQGTEGMRRGETIAPPPVHLQFVVPREHRTGTRELSAQGAQGWVHKAAKEALCLHSMYLSCFNSLPQLAYIRTSLCIYKNFLSETFLTSLHVKEKHDILTYQESRYTGDRSP